MPDEALEPDENEMLLMVRRLVTYLLKQECIPGCCIHLFIPYEKPIDPKIYKGGSSAWNHWK